jgi:hypothetical protein
MCVTDFGRLRERYVGLFGEEPVNEGVIGAIEGTLNIELPADLKRIAAFYSGGFLGGISHHAIDVSGPANNIVEETRRLRLAINLPKRFVVLAEPADSLIVLDCTADGVTNPAVIWCDAHDVVRLNDPATMHKPDRWSTYAGFFSGLLDQEDEERAQGR